MDLFDRLQICIEDFLDARGVPETLTTLIIGIASAIAVLWPVWLIGWLIYMKY